ncbi:hypothetical protein ALC53_07136 [Atta colombica]|uniref:Uncharacterized protein n=1 Tax=Atta colombica TaxID=520822 RepID=A0A195BCR4_9HYME|nr:hypothetical protein ALC53_07136 [Atta colombica]
MSTSYISFGVHCVGRVASAPLYTRGLHSHFLFRGSTPPALLTLIKNKKKAENDEKQKRGRGMNCVLNRPKKQDFLKSINSSFVPG